MYHYDVLGRLTLVESALNSNVKLAAYRYDTLGRLAMQVTYDPNDPNDPNDDDLYAASNVTKYFYYDTPVGGDGASSPVLPQVVEVKDGSGDTTDQFVWGPAYVDELLMHERDADGDPNNVLEQRLYAAHDTLYSVLELVDEDGNEVERYSYSPYGADPLDPRKGIARITDGDENELTPDDSVAQALYTGRQFDKTVGLNYHRARRLNHNLGRWTRRDPLGVSLQVEWSTNQRVTTNFGQLQADEQYSDGPNLYGYTMSCPCASTDPDGLRRYRPDPHGQWGCEGGVIISLPPKVVPKDKRFDPEYWYNRFGLRPCKFPKKPPARNRKWTLDEYVAVAFGASVGVERLEFDPEKLTFEPTMDVSSGKVHRTLHRFNCQYKQRCKHASVKETKPTGPWMKWCIQDPLGIGGSSIIAQIWTRFERLLYKPW